MNAIKQHIEIFPLLLLAASITFFMFVLKDKKQTPLVVPSFLTRMAPTPTPTVEPYPRTSVTAFDSSDGVKTLTMKKVDNKTSVSYTFSTANKGESSQKQIFSKTIDPSQTISIPFNAWSPDNNYVFLKENTHDGSNYYVMTTSGDPLPRGQAFVNIKDFFTTRYPDYILTDVTGWASPTLLIVNTNNKDNTQGPSLWFDIPSQTFIPLATRFN